MKRGHLHFACVIGNGHGAAEVGAGSRKRLGDDHAIPGVQDPGALDSNVKAADGLAGLLGQHDRAGFGDVTRAARAVDGEHSGVAVFQFAAHSDEGPNRSARTRPAYRAEAELLENARDIFAVKAAADHDRDLLAPETIACWNHATMPEAPDSAGRAPAVAQAVLFAHNSEAQRGTQAANEQISRPGNQPQRYPLAQRERAYLGALRPRFNL